MLVVYTHMLDSFLALLLRVTYFWRYVIINTQANNIYLYRITAKLLTSLRSLNPSKNSLEM